MSDGTPINTAHASSVAAPALSVPTGGSNARWYSAFWLALLLCSGLKVYLANHLAPFVDEAFYWQESRQLAWSYSDVPALMAWLIRASETVFGHSTLAMRAPFLLLGAGIPLLMVSLVGDMAGARVGWQAGLWTLALPLLGTLGVLALPDVPLTFASMLALWALQRATTRDRWYDWGWLGLALAIAWLSHYRAAVLLVSGLAFFALSARGRRFMTLPGLWLALALSCLGLLPLWLFNQQHEWAGLSFQLRDRHPWSFHADALVQPLEQALVVTPFLYALLLLVLFVALRRRQRGAPWDLMGLAAVVPLLGYFLVGLFADGERFRVHWPIPGYLPLIAVLPLLIQERSSTGSRLWRWWPPLAAIGGALGGALVLAYLLLASQPSMSSQLSTSKLFPSGFVGWNEAAAMLDRARAQAPVDSLVVADNFILAAQLDFAAGTGAPLYVLDSPLNHKHGRAAQLAMWARDESALRQQAGANVLLVVDETALRARQRPAWLQSLCGRVSDLVPIERIDLYEGRKRMAVYSGRVAGTSHASSICSYPPAAVVRE